MATLVLRAMHTALKVAERSLFPADSSGYLYPQLASCAAYLCAIAAAWRAAR